MAEGRSVATDVLGKRVITAAVSAPERFSPEPPFEFSPDVTRDLLIFDEIGYLPVVPGGGNLFFLPVNARCERGAVSLH